nr:Presenilin-2 [Polyrhizophydium stewartii]
MDTAIETSKPVTNLDPIEAAVEASMAQGLKLQSHPSLAVLTTKEPRTSVGMPADSREAAALLSSVLPRDVDPTKSHLAYGRQAIPKLIDQLDENKLFPRQRAIVFLADLFHSPENVSQGISEGIVPQLVSYLGSEDLTCRQKATEALDTIASHAIGRNDIIQRRVLKPLSGLFGDPDHLVRKHVFDTFAKTTTQREDVLEFGLFVPIIERLTTERMEIQVPMLETCYNCIRLGKPPAMPDMALGCEAMQIFTDIARRSLVSEVKVAACRCIMMLSITIDCDAKRIMVRENALTALTDLLSDSHELVQLNVIKTITNCAEDYRGRFQLHQCIRKATAAATAEAAADGPRAEAAAGADAHALHPQDDDGDGRRFRGDGEPSEEERIQDMRFYMAQIYIILKPVMLCIALSVLWVKLSHPLDSYFDTGVPVAVSAPSSSVGQVLGTTGNSQNDTNSLLSALLILGQIVVATFIIACLFRYGKIKIIIGIFVFVVMLLLGFFGYTLGLTLLIVANAALDWISFAFFTWNLVAVGLAVIFWKGPLIVQQGYLVVMSSMMAFSLSAQPDLVTWILLALLAIWDLIAVLCPFGPLRMLLESSQQQGQEIPAALLYSDRGDFELQPVAQGSQERSAQEREDNLQLDAEEAEESGLKLGLGDFVFYSVLVGRASLFDWITTVSTIIAVTAGLCATIYMLAVYRRPLPALPFSIAFGILFYLVAATTLTPFIDGLIVRPTIVAPPAVGSNLWVGKNMGGGMIYL